MSVTHGEQTTTLEEHGEAGGRGINWWGMIFFITSEALIFANIIASFLYLEIRNGSWQVPTELLLPLINTFILLGSSIPIRYLAGRGIARGNQRNLRLGLFLTILMGTIFLLGQLYEYSGLFGEHFTPQASVFAGSFFALTGFHGLHVTVGLIFLAIVWVRAVGGAFTAKKHWAVQAGEMYWHFVDGVWVVVFSTVYLLPLIRG
jgi:cytochrome c oxidase subunit III